MGKGPSNVDTRVAKTAASADFETEEVKLAGNSARRRIAAANSRDRANAFWTSLLSANGGGAAGGTQGKNTLG